MQVMRRVSILFVIAILVIIILVSILNLKGSFEPFLLLPILNSVLIGFVLIALTIISGTIYLQSCKMNLLWMSGGMLVFGLGSILAGWLRFVPGGANISVTIFNCCALAGGGLNLLSALWEDSYTKIPDNLRIRKTKLFSCYLGIGVFMAVLVLATIMKITHPFVDQNGFTNLRQSIVWTSILLYFSASVVFYRNYQRLRTDHLYWYFMSLLLIAIGLYGACEAKVLGGYVNWLGRVTEYIGCLVALFAMDIARRHAKKREIDTAKVFDDFFVSAEISYKSLVEASSDAILSIDQYFRIFYMNSSAERLFGYTCNEVENGSFLDLLILEEDRDRLRADLDAFVLQGVNSLHDKPLEIQCNDKGGRHFSAEISISKRKLISNYVTTYIIRDVSERKKSQEALRQSEALLRTIMEGTSDSIYLKDSQSRIVIANTAKIKEVGLPANQIIGYTSIDYYQNKEKAQIIIDNDKRVMDNDKGELVEEIVPSADGDRINLSLKEPWHDAKGSVIGLIGISRDITCRKKMEEELQQKNKELANKNKIITDFFTNVSHEFKTPLSIILIQLELMQFFQEDEKKMKEMIAVATQNSYRLSRLIGNILDITKTEAGYSKVHYETVDIVSLIQDICDSVNEYANHKSIQMVFNTELTVKMMPVDIEKIERIMLNLLSNAIKNTKNEGTIEVNLEGTREGGILLSVEDTGAGIPQDKLATIFDRFAQVDTSLNRLNEGCGIGLALVKSKVDLLGGTISVKSALGIGSKFTVELPFVEKEPLREIANPIGFCLAKKVQMEFSDL